MTQRLLLVGQEQDKGKWPQAVPGEAQVGYWEQFLHGIGCPALAQLCRAGVEPPSLEGFKSPVDVALGDVGQHFGLGCAENGWT